MSVVGTAPPNEVVQIFKFNYIFSASSLGALRGPQSLKKIFNSTQGWTPWVWIHNSDLPVALENKISFFL